MTASSGPSADPPGGRVGPQVSLETIAKEWTRIGLIGFGGPPSHISLLRRLVVERRGWIDARSFEDANAACGLLPGPASTQLAILCAYRVGGPAGAIVGGLGFIVPAVILIIAASTVVLGQSPPLWLKGASAGAGAAVAAVAVRAAADLVGPSRARARREGRGEQAVVGLPAGRGRGRRADRSLPGPGAAGLRRL